MNFIHYLLHLYIYFWIHNPFGAVLLHGFWVLFLLIWATAEPLSEEDARLIYGADHLHHFDLHHGATRINDEGTLEVCCSHAGCNVWATQEEANRVDQYIT